MLAHDRADRATDNAADNAADNAYEEPTHGANGRCHQENLIQQLKNGMHTLKAPVDNLESNWAYMVMTTLAWNMKA